VAQRVKVELVDDVDGVTEADETVTFALDGVSYEIDLSRPNAERLRNDFASWVGHARRSGGRRAGSRGGSASSRGRKGSDLAKVREWARKNGHTVSDRGRISADVQAAYDKAHSRS
jgi:hypothetical protein